MYMQVNGCVGVEYWLCICRLMGGSEYWLCICRLMGAGGLLVVYMQFQICA